MDIRKNKAFTLQELLIVIAIVAIMMIILISSGRVLRTQSDLRDAKNTLLVLSTALEKYHERHGRYPFEAQPYLPDVLVNDPTDDSGYDRDDLADDILTVLGIDQVATPYTPFIYSEQRNYQASIEGLYFFLKNDPVTREIIGSLPEKYITAKDPTDPTSYELLTVPGASPPLVNDSVRLIRIIDPWGNPLRYVYENGNGIAVVESAGPDGRFSRTPAGFDTVEDEKDLDNISY